MEKLFNDSETFQKNRPVKLTEKQENEIWQKKAFEVIKNGWSDDDIENIIEDLKQLSFHDSGYEKAKELESFGMNCYYEIDTDFIEWLDCLDFDFETQKIKNVREWVKSHNITPKFPVGSELIIKKQFNFRRTDTEFSEGGKVYVNGIYEDQGTYKVSNVMFSTINRIIDFEILESHCELIKNG